MRFGRFKTFIFDLDGTVWTWDKLIPGAEKILNNLIKEGKQCLFITNNTILPRDGIVKKLRTFGIPVNKNEVITSSFVAAEYLRGKKARVFAIGDGIKKELKAVAKITEKKPDYVVVGHDFNFNYEKLSLACTAIKNGAKFLSCGKGRYFIHGNKLDIGTGVFVNTIEYATGKKSILIGKPSRFMNYFIDLFNASPKKQTVLIGDELAADIKTGQDLGYFTVLVRTGIDKITKKIKPDMVINSIADIKI